MGEGGLFPTPCGPCAKPLGSLKLMHCPLFCLAAVQEMKQKRVKGKKVTQTYGLAPPLWAVEPALPRAEPGWKTLASREQWVGGPTDRALVASKLSGAPSAGKFMTPQGSWAGLGQAGSTLF